MTGTHPGRVVRPPPQVAVAETASHGVDRDGPGRTTS
jgi:hypothetical protein